MARLAETCRRWPSKLGMLGTAETCHRSPTSASDRRLRRLRPSHSRHGRRRPGSTRRMRGPAGDILPRRDLLTPNLQAGQMLRPLQGLETPETAAAILLRRRPFTSGERRPRAGKTRARLLDRWPAVLRLSARASGAPYPRDRLQAGRGHCGCPRPPAVATRCAGDRKGLRQSRASLGRGSGSGPRTVGASGLAGLAGQTCRDHAEEVNASASAAFPTAPRPAGLYPLSTAAWLERLLPLGTSTVQLRPKICPHGLEREIDSAIEVAVASARACSSRRRGNWP